MLRKYAAHNSLLPFYLAWQIDPGGSHYNVSFSYQLESAQQANHLILKLQELIKHKAYLRQTFSIQKNQLIATIHDDLPAEINFFTSSTADFEKLEQVLTKKPYEINIKSSIRLNIIKLNDCNNYVALFTFHHIIMDGPTLDHFMTHLNRLIADKKIGQESADEYISRLANEYPLQEEKINPTIADYIEKINNIANEISYPIGDKNIICYYTNILPDLVMQKLMSFSKLHYISIFNLLLIAWGVFSSKLFNNNIGLIKYPVNVRTDKSIDGCFLNVVVVPVHFTTEDTYLSLIHAWCDKIVILKQAAKVMLNDKLDIGLIPSFANSTVADDALIIDGKRYETKNFPQIGHSNLNIKYREQSGKYYFTCDIFAESFPEYLCSSLLSRFFNYLDKLVANPSALLSSTDLTFNEEKSRLLYDFNNTDIFYPQDRSLVDLFEEQVLKTPDNTAIVYETIRLTYAELNEQANQLAHYLRNHYQIKPDDLIALLLDRNEYMLISILGVMKAGGAYVPIDPSYPPERINYILKDTQAKVILANEIYRDKLNHRSTETRGVIAIGCQEVKAELAKQIKINPVTNTIRDNLAYVIYTSGTTGIPKGVMIEHKSVVNTLLSLDQVYGYHQTENILKITAFTSYVFDVSVSEFFIALLKGYELHILSNALRQDVILISKYINTHQINYIYLPPVLLRNLPRIKYQSLQGIIYAGEPCDKDTALYWSNKCKLYNYYGPTETSIYTTGLQLEAGEVNLIGKSISNTTAYVLNAEMNLLPIGIVGELYIGGVGLARGYLNQHELTGEKFIINLFQTKKEHMAKKNARLYKTGDLVRWLPDGNLEYIGRDDFQVKIMGYRIELSEIESRLASYPEIQQVVVLVKNILANDRNDKYLVAYYVANKKLDESKLYNYCMTILPEYMLPKVFVHLYKLPLMINGKIDRKSLPDPAFEYVDDYVAPDNEQEQLICAEFSQILGLEKVGVNDDFFKLGGSSIKAITLVVRLQANFSINVSDIYNLKTPRQIAKKMFFEKDNLKRYLEKMKLAYQVQSIGSTPDQQLQDKLNKYMASTPKCLEIHQKKSLASVLLTGSTGFLGCNLLNEILNATDYKVFLLARAQSHDGAYARINKKFQFYFDKNLDSVHNLRLFVFAADIEKNDLSLSATDYQALVAQVDSIIHSAAITKHYGESDRFYSANVQATINLLELCKLTRLKDFHYISTASVFDKNGLRNYKQAIFTEDDIPENVENQPNIYIKTKRQGEEAVISYRQYGITSSIYRVGNMAFMASNCCIQENSEDNGFFNRMRCILDLGIIAEEISMEEISPADLTAQAIIKLFDKKTLNNYSYHVFNPNLFNLADFFSKNDFLKVKVVPINQFINTITGCVRESPQQELIDRFLVHQGWLNEWHTPLKFMRILQGRTHAILQQLGFAWMPINYGIFSQYLKTEIRNDEKSKNAEIPGNYCSNTSNAYLLGR